MCTATTVLRFYKQKSQNDGGSRVVKNYYLTVNDALGVLTQHRKRQQFKQTLLLCSLSFHPVGMRERETRYTPLAVSTQNEFSRHHQGDSRARGLVRVYLGTLLEEDAYLPVSCRRHGRHHLFHLHFVSRHGKLSLFRRNRRERHLHYYGGAGAGDGAGGWGGGAYSCFMHVTAVRSAPWTSGPYDKGSACCPTLAKSTGWGEGREGESC